MAKKRKKTDSERRTIIRRHKTLAKKPNRVRVEQTQVYEDNLGNLYDYKWLAKMASCYNIFEGCLHNGFPIVVKWLWYNAWAFWPFFFVKANLQCEDPLPILNHERIHCRQQWDIIIIFAPIFILWAFFSCVSGHGFPMVTLSLPFIPTMFYCVDLVFSFFRLKRNRRKITFQSLREETCFEREANAKALNYEYLHERKYMAVLAYTGIRLFRNYGV